MDPQTASALLAQYHKVKDDPARFGAYFDDPVGFVRDIFGVEPWEKQREFMEAVRDNFQTAWKTGNGIGKTASLAWLIFWWFYARQGRVVTTAPTREHLEDALWAEVAKWKRQAKVHLPIDVMKLDMRVDADWYATGLSTDTEGAFQGRHHPRLLVLIDEAGGDIPDRVFVEAFSCAIDPKGNRVALCGNPTRTSGTFYECFKHPDVWHCMTTSCFEHPNVLAKESLIEGAVSIQRVEQRRAEWGETHPFWYSLVLGEFPMISNRGVIPLGTLERSQNDAKHTEALEKAKAQRMQRVAALDVARYGDNRCVFSLRRGDAIEHLESWSHVSTMETTGRAIVLMRDWNARTLVVDASGIGGGVVDRLFELDLPFHVQAFNSQSRAARSGLYSNRRAELWWHIRQRLEKERLWLPKSRPNTEYARLTADLLAVEYLVASSGRIQIESKEDMLERGVKSPDYGDALVMCFATEVDPEDDLVPPKTHDQDPQVYEELTQPEPTFGQLPHSF